MRVDSSDKDLILKLLGLKFISYHEKKRENISLKKTNIEFSFMIL